MNQSNDPWLSTVLGMFGTVALTAAIALFCVAYLIPCCRDAKQAPAPAAKVEAPGPVASIR